MTGVAGNRSHEGRGLGHRVLFRVDGGRVWGLSMGHVSRCLSLARELVGRGLSSFFLMRDYAVGTSVVERSGFPVQVLPVEITPQEDRKATYSLAHVLGASAVIIDLPDPGKLLGSYEPSSRVVTVVIDHFGGIGDEAEIVINESVLARPALYPGVARTRLLLGPRYFILDESYERIDPEKKKRTGPVRHILVTMGGSDPLGVTVRIARFFAASSFSLDLTLVLGPGFEGQGEVEASLDGYRGAYRIVIAPPTLAPLFAEADLAIMAGGRTPYEAAFVGVPGIIIPSIEHETGTAQAFSHRGAFLSLPSGQRLLQDRFDPILGGALERLQRDQSLRQDMSERARMLVDGRGTDRVVRQFLSTLEPCAR